MREASESVELLRLAQKRFSHLIGSLPICIIIARSDGVIESVNRSVVELFGYSEDALLGQHVNLIFSQPPWGKDELLIEWYHRQGQNLIELRGLDAASEVIPVDLNIRLFDPERSDRLLLVIQDVTNRFVAEQLKKNFFQMVNHDLRSPLTNVFMFLKTLETSNDFGSLSPLGEERVKNASLNLQRILKLTDELLQLESLESGVGTLNQVEVDAYDLVSKSILSVSEVARAKDVRVEFALNVERISGDIGRLEQVLINFLSNAIGHNTPGQPVRLINAQRESMVRFSVHDSGQGVPESDRLIIFERFWQGISKGSGRHGLGLAICKEIIGQHGGTIGCSASDVLNGSEFWFEIPHLLD